MFKIINLIIKIGVLVIMVIGGMYIYSNYVNVGPDFSPAQAETIELMGSPEQFLITYLPKKGEKDDQLIRQEAWLYPNKQKKFTFLGGSIISTSDLEKVEPVEKTVLNPKDFDFYTSLEEVERIIGKVNLAFIELPGFSDSENEIQTYTSKEAVFIFEQGFLTFMETLY